MNGIPGAELGPFPVAIDWSRNGGVAEWLGRGLQSPAQRFDSAPRLGIIGTLAGRLAQGESASLTRKRSEVQILQRPQAKALVTGPFLLGEVRTDAC